MKKSSVKKSMTLDNLAGMVQRGFSELNGNMNTRFEFVEKRLDNLEQGQEDMKSRLDNLEQGQEDMKSRLDNLEQGQEDIKLRIGNVAYRFELVDLQKRVEVLERKTSVRHR